MNMVLKSIVIIYMASKNIFWDLVDIRSLKMKEFVIMELSDSNKILVDIEGKSKHCSLSSNLNEDYAIDIRLNTHNFKAILGFNLFCAA